MTRALPLESISFVAASIVGVLSAMWSLQSAAFPQGFTIDADMPAGNIVVDGAANSVKGLKIARTCEVPFANANGAVVTPETCRDLGRDTAKVFRALLGDAPYRVRECRM